MRKIFGKVMWVGRTAATLFGLALVLALVFGVATTAIGATGGAFILGKANAASTPSSLAASIAKPTLTLINKSTDAAATTLNISVDAGNPPLKVNASAGKAVNLDADKLDGKDASEFASDANKNGKADAAEQADNATNATNAGNADTVDGKHATDFAAAGHNHDGRYYSSGSKVDDSLRADNATNAANATNAGNADKLDNLNSSDFQRNCNNGAVRGYAQVDASDTFSSSFTTSGVSPKFNCASTAGPYVKRATEGNYRVCFPGNYAQIALVSPMHSGDKAQWGRYTDTACNSPGNVAFSVHVTDYWGTADEDFSIVVY